MKKTTVYLLSLGCAKNQVDSEVMVGALQQEGFSMVHSPELADAILINTCAFIEAAKEESIAAILEHAEYKQSGRCRLLGAVGCMPEKYAEEMMESLPELDVIAGSQDYALISTLLAEKLGHEISNPNLGQRDPYLLRSLTPGAMAYLKIAEGCDNACSYCLIPQLRGAYISRPLEDILAEAKRIRQAGVQEIVLIAQDTTCYGLDLYGDCRLAELLQGVAELGFAMVRLLYAYPDRLDDDVLRVMAAHPNICRYLDVPVQHGADSVLEAMCRNTTQEELLQRLNRIREFLPDVALRSTVMVGFPGETEDDFAELISFLMQANFDWLGAFAYSQEDDTPAALLPDQIDEEVKQERLDQVMQLAAAITEKSLQRFLGQTLAVLAEEPADELGEGWFAGRSQYHAPEVDGWVYFQSASAAEIEIGKIYQVRITDSEIYDLFGETE